MVPTYISINEIKELALLVPACGIRKSASLYNRNITTIKQFGD